MFSLSSKIRRFCGFVAASFWAQTFGLVATPLCMAVAEEDAPNTLHEDDYDEFDDYEEALPCSWRYVAVCILLPALNGALNAFIWPSYTLHFSEQGWSLVSAGLSVTIGFVLRMTTQQMQLYAGYWLIIPLAVIHLAFAILGLIYPTTEWAVFAQIVAVMGIDPTCAIEGICFDSFGDSENKARQASSTCLSVFTIAVALSCTVGGIVFDFAGWTGVACYHTCAEGFLLLLLVFEPACRKSFREVFFPSKDDSLEESLEEAKTEAEGRFAEVVPGEAASEPKLPGVIEEEEMQVEDVEDQKLESVREKPWPSENDNDKSEREVRETKPGPSDNVRSHGVQNPQSNPVPISFFVAEAAGVATFFHLVA